MSANQDYLNMHNKITETVVEKAKNIAVDLEVDSAKLQELVDGVTPITSVVNVPIDKDEFLALAEEITNHISTHQPQLSEVVQAIIKTLKTTDRLDEFVTASKKLDLDFFVEFGEEHNINPSITQFLGEMAYRSYAIAFAKLVLQDIDLANYRNNLCPVCGEKVRIMSAHGDDKREACCTRCDTVWELNPLQCPHCKNDDHEKLHYIKAGADEGRKVYACNVCKEYVKQIDAKDFMNKPSHFIVDLETIYLDMLAAQQGYGAKVK
ncbi:formate dehydrogenase accessory protein FdhE [Desulfuribacillus alkaliarsenatis]|uniref:Formate dehydrogenase accessory protein FdhE n=1 Tax=Desulfuribacillus alkaliarsenatis TaxID=766136 RepID=A0A1E5G209_9FIRM|nr:formate dehydrogenase accessory protein FdhE [Desulfuribacillus alkaliarsenatis]OEF97006.1 hypothetical protein BHF68_05235 [Desulfuribacillus alkaliarsenatis]